MTVWVCVLLVELIRIKPPVIADLIRDEKITFITYIEKYDEKPHIKKDVSILKDAIMFKLHLKTYLEGKNISQAINKISNEIEDSKEKETILKFIKLSERGVIKGILD